MCLQQAVQPTMAENFQKTRHTNRQDDILQIAFGSGNYALEPTLALLPTWIKSLRDTLFVVEKF